MDLNNSNNFTKKVLKFIIVLIIFSSFYPIIFKQTKQTSGQMVDQTESLMNKQMKLEMDFVIEGYTIENPNVILDPYGISPLTALVMFETEEETDIKVIVKGKDKYSDVVLYSLSDTKHYLPVYGLYPDTINKVILETDNNEYELEITTAPLPENLTHEINISADKEHLNPGEFYFVSPASRGYTSAYDINGDVRWYLTENLVWDISKLNNGKLLLSTERPINPPYFTTGLYEIDFLGKIYTEFSLPGGYHHDFFELSNGNLLVASDEFDNEHGTVEDIIVEIERKTGNIIKTWDLKEVLNMEDGKSENWVNYDWFHNNSVWYDAKTNSIILSGRHQDAVISIDYDTSELNWIIGDPTNWSEEYQEYFFTPIDENGNEINNDKDKFEWQWSQHAAMVTPEGYIFILDNGNNKSKLPQDYVPAENSYTRGVMYEINTDNMTIKQIFQYGKERGSEFYSPYISDVDYLGENHYIIHSGGIVYVDGKISNQPAGFAKNAEMYSTTVELLNNQVIFEMTLPNNYYRAEKMSFVNNFSLGEPRKLGGLGETKSTSVNKNVLKEYIETDDYIEKYNVDFAKEEDRLIIKGKFPKEELVEILLEQNGNVKKYFVRVSKKPYTALCLDLFVQEETDNMLEIEKYINNEGLKGYYNIYLRIGDYKYKTNKTVEF